MECPIQPPERNIESVHASKIIWRNRLFTFENNPTTTPPVESSVNTVQTAVSTMEHEREMSVNPTDMMDSSTEKFTEMAANSSVAHINPNRKKRSTSKSNQMNIHVCTCIRMCVCVCVCVCVCDPRIGPR